MKLSEKQIDSLYGFTKRHFVEWFDVQTELVDHLANDIELILENNPNISFSEARDKSFKKFGVMGFSEVVEQKTNALDKYYRRLVWRELITFFKLPKIIFTGFLICILYTLFNTIENKDFIIIPIFSFLTIYPFYHIIMGTRKIRQREKITGRKWLFESAITRFGGLIPLFNFGIYLPIFNTNNSNWSLMFTVFASSFIVIFCLVLYVSIKIVIPNVREKLINEHPDYLFI
jgi:hypothetical protein